MRDGLYKLSGKGKTIGISGVYAPISENGYKYAWYITSKVWDLWKETKILISSMKWNSVILPKCVILEDSISMYLCWIVILNVL